MRISYRLLRLINSAYFALPQPVGSVHHALVMLGIEKVRMWTVLIALAEIDDRPSELVRTALSRAKMCELIARATGAATPEAHFTAGLFSLVEAFADIRTGRRRGRAAAWPPTCRPASCSGRGRSGRC